MLEKQGNISRAHLAAARAVDSLRRQLPIVIKEDDGNSLQACPIEGISQESLTELRASGRVSLLLTGARAKTLGLGMGTVRIDAQDLTLSHLQALADPLSDKAAPPKPALLPTLSSQGMLLTLTKYSGLLPGVLIFEGKSFPEEWVRVAMAEVKTYWNNPQLDIVPLAGAMLPLQGAEATHITCLRERYGTSTHLVMRFGTLPDAPLVRIHSSCVTGDILGSLRCDCGDQLKLAIDALKTSGGLLLYLHQEGRGIGIANKLRAYALQEKGSDTYDANLMLGYDEDERDFRVAATILKKLGVGRIRLMTNNPHKIAALEKAEIAIAERVPLVAPSGRHNHAYLSAKAKKSGHLF